MSKHTWQYNPVTDTWLSKADYPHPTSGGAFFTINGKGYQIGGFDSTTNLYGSDNNAYDPVADTWTPKTPFSEAGLAGGYFFVINGKAYVGARERNASEGGSVSGYSYDPVGDIWPPIADYPGNPSIGLCTFTIDSFGYAGLGGDGNGDYFNDMFKYNPSTNTWSRIASYPGKGRYNDFSSFVVNGKGYAGTGQTENSALSAVYNLGDYYMYDPITNTWSPAPGILGPQD